MRPEGSFKSNWPWMALMFLAVVLVYLPVLNNDFVNWDDHDVVTDNLHIRFLNADSLRWMFTTFTNGNWMPLTWISLALTYLMGGLKPEVFHMTNVLLHAFNTLWVFLFCLRLIRVIPSGGNPNMDRIKSFAQPIAFLTALLFGLHPLHVESVAWATERKDVLYSFFYLWALYLYLDNNPEPKIQKSKLFSCLFLYLLSLLSKPMAITLPFVFLILDGWPLERYGLGWRILLREKIPLFILAALSVGVTMLSHFHTLSYGKSGLEIYWVMNAFRSMVFYPLKMVWPSGLCAYYPLPPQITTFYVLQNIGAAALVVFLSFFLFRRRESTPSLLAAWAYYLLTLLPVVGLVQTGNQAAADRYTYLPCLGFFLLFAAGLARWAAYSRVIFGLAVALAGGTLGILTVGQIGTWKNTQTLWERVTALYPDENPDEYSRLGVVYLKAHRYDEALEAFGKASVIPPPMARTFHGLGTALVYKDRIPEAIKAFNYALQLDPTFNAPHVNLWSVYERLGRHEEAITQIKEAIRLEPASGLFYNDLGVSYSFLKRYPEAREAFGNAHRLDPGNSEYLVNLATICQWEGKPGESLDWYRKGTALNPHEPVYYLKMGDIYLDQGKKKKALEVLRKAWELHPATAKVAQQIGEDFQKLGKLGLAQTCFAEAKRLSAVTSRPTPEDPSKSDQN